MSDRFDPGYFSAIAIFALLTAAAVIVGAGYYESPLLLLMQVVFIAGPTFVPLAILSRRGAGLTASRVALALFITAGWAYVVYVDTRPYTGGGASFALLVGWFTCFVAGFLAAAILALHSWFNRSR